MKKSTSLKKLSLKKLTISRLTNLDMIEGGSGICGTKSDPVEDCKFITCLYSNCRSCTDQANTLADC